MSTARSSRRGVRWPLVTAGLMLGLTGCANGPGAATPTPTPVQAAPATAAASAGAFAPAPAPSAAPPAPGTPLRLIGESASIEFDPGAERALENAQLEYTAEDPTLGQLPGYSDGRDTVHFPIEDGIVTPTARPPGGRVELRGNARLTHDGTTVTFTDPVVDLDARTVRATVDGRPVSMIDLDLSRARFEADPNLPPEIVDVDGRLSADALRELGERLGVVLDPDTMRVDLEIRMRTS